MAIKKNVKQAAFLAAFAECGVITEAARAAKVNRTDHYDWLLDPEYSAAFDAAKEQAIELMESEARRRAIEGVAEPVIYQGSLCFEPLRDKSGKIKRDPKTKEVLFSKKPLVVYKKSDILLMFLLKAAKPDTYRENSKVELSGSVNLVVDRLLAGRQRLAKRGK